MMDQKYLFIDTSITGLLVRNHNLHVTVLKQMVKILGLTTKFMIELISGTNTTQNSELSAG